MTATATVPPLAGTLGRLAALDPYLTAGIGQPTGADWHRLDGVVAGGQVDRWLADLMAQHGGQSNVAGAYLGAWLAGAVLTVPVAALVLERRVPVLAAGDVWVHRHPEGWFDRIALRAPAVAVLAGDAAGGHADSRVLPDEAGLLEAFAEQLVATLEPLLGAVRARARYGLRGLWGAVADDLTGTALWAAELAGRDQAEQRAHGADPGQAWRVGTALTDRVATRVPQLRARPRLFPVSWSRGKALAQVKGTCCLYFRTYDGVPDPSGEGYCTTCPFREDESRRRRLRDHLEHRDKEQTCRGQRHLAAAARCADRRHPRRPVSDVGDDRLPRERGQGARRARGRRAMT